MYGFCNGSAAAAVREYRRRYPGRPTPSRQTFINVHLSLAENGIRRPASERGRIVSPEEEEEVLRLISHDPRLSVRKIANQLSLTTWAVWRILKSEGLHPYHFRRVQDITEADYAVRATFCSWVLRSVRQEPQFLRKIMWTDEAKFTRAGIVNHRNDHLWMAENPHAVRASTFQHEFSINVWAAIIDDKLIGPIELPHTLNGPRFLEFLTNDLTEALGDLPLIYRRGMWLQLDGAPAHFARAVREHLDANHSPWIGRGGTVAWPPRSPDMTPLDFFLWGHMKQKVYFNVPNTREELLQKIMMVADEIRADSDMVRRATSQVATRATVCLMNQGGHFEQFLS